ncbi:MAG: hypothetical protein KO206_04770 [Methanomicrobiaceae archaeon]|uniref:Phytol kinase n=1 Tax=hydrocarbon metagenome TaxID=938273 RepID=A0A0W8FEL5_9ZZZZ|nr:hypothetical protein [Methanomicrobiaceae archaeon]MDD5419011.1 hypothetical protein [Methanomicrobiaceae archaeon]
MREILRKTVHLVVGLGIAGFVAVAEQRLAVAVLMLAIFVGFILSDALAKGYTIPLVSPIIERLERREAVPGTGALFFVLSALFCLVFFEPGIVVLALIVLAVLDSVTTLVGMRFGKTRIYNRKTLEGTLAGIAMTSAVLVPFLSPAPALLVAGAAGIVELLSPVDDNLVIPLCACLILTFLP